MCFKVKQKTIEEIIAENSVGMTDEEKAQYFYELNQNIFRLLGWVEVEIWQIDPAEWIETAQSYYPSLRDIKIADDVFYTTNLQGIALVLTKDWSNLVPFEVQKGNCDKFATRLYSHLCDYYGVTAVFPVWGDTHYGYHGFNLGVFREGKIWVAKLIEPQTDSIFDEFGPMGQYIPRKTAMELGIKSQPLKA
jgi:hypothetical protein